MSASTCIEGVGLGLRSQHYEALLSSRRDVPWLEVLVDNYAHGDGLPLRHLDRARALYPVVFHGVGMSLGSTDPLDGDYVAAIRRLARRIEPAWISEHLAWVSAGGRHHHELLPLPFCEEAVGTVAAHVREVQDRLGQRILVENAAGYLRFACSRMSEAEFIAAVVAEADCDLLLDVSNLHVNARNHGYDPLVFLETIPGDRVRQMHLAGYDDHGSHLIDAHGSPVSEATWALFIQVQGRFPGVPTCIEWDRDVPPFAVLAGERTRAAAIVDAAVDAAQREACLAS
jgi:uncharacterized protein (UPF0276 family)